MNYGLVGGCCFRFALVLTPKVNILLEMKYLVAFIGHNLCTLPFTHPGVELGRFLYGHQESILENIVTKRNQIHQPLLILQPH